MSPLRQSLWPLRRYYSTTTVPSPSSSSALPSEIAAQFLSHWSSQPPRTTTQLLDPNQLRLFSLTLNRPRLPRFSSSSDPIDLRVSTPPAGTPLPPTYHLAYFPPAQLPTALGPDGTDTTYNAPAPFTRRMWAGGLMRFSPRNPLRVGQTVRETTAVLDCRAKRVRRTGEEMLVVTVRKTLANEAGNGAGGDVSVEDVREWVFRRGVQESTEEKVLEEKEKDEKEERRLVRETKTRAGADSRKRWHLVQTPETLFRFSALTFNAHRIHYDAEWCRRVEGHRERVVHGPLNLVTMSDFWRDELAAAGRGLDGKQDLAEVRYRATSPVYVGEGYAVREGQGSGGEEGGGGGGGGGGDEDHTRVEVVSDDGTLCMWGLFKGA